MAPSFPQTLTAWLKKTVTPKIPGVAVFFFVVRTQILPISWLTGFPCHFRNNSQADTQCAYAGEKYKNEEGGKIVQNFANVWEKREPHEHIAKKVGTGYGEGEESGKIPAKAERKGAILCLKMRNYLLLMKKY